jgi:membrane-associated protease RseP (regulator of RpoE activity)
MIIFLSSLLVIIILHEASHLLVAKLCGCGVIRYSIGFGKPVLFSKMINGTVYQITPWIFGGFCELKDELTCNQDADSFSNQTYSKKLSISIAGCVANLLIGIACILLSFKIHYLVFYFGVMNILLGVSNLLPIPALDGSYPFLFLFEKFFKKQQVYEWGNKVFGVFLKILLISNLIALPFFLFSGIKMINDSMFFLWNCYRGII